MPEISEAAIIDEARTNLGEADVVTLLDALESFYGHGFSDDSVGEMSWAEGHCFRVARWLVWTESSGSRYVESFDSEDAAAEAIIAYGDRLERLEIVNALTEAARELGAEGRLADPTDSDVLIYAAESLDPSLFDAEYDLAKLEPIEVRQIIDAYDRGTGL